MHEETGLLVERNEPHEVAAAMRLLLIDNDTRSRMAHNGQELVTRYSWRTAAEQFVELYRQCLVDQEQRGGKRRDER